MPSAGPSAGKRALGLLLLLLAASGVQADIRIRAASVILDQGRYLLEARIDVQLGAEVREALDSGVPLVFVTTVRLERSRDYLWSATVTRTSHRLRLQYHALSRQYLITDLLLGETESFPTLRAALHWLGRIKHLPIIEQKLLRGDQEYFVEVRTRLDIESLPTPMRLVAYLSPQWHLGSGWYRVEVKP